MVFFFLSSYIKNLRDLFIIDTDNPIPQPFLYWSKNTKKGNFRQSLRCNTHYSHKSADAALPLGLIAFNSGALMGTLFQEVLVAHTTLQRAPSVADLY